MKQGGLSKLAWFLAGALFVLALRALQSPTAQLPTVQGADGNMIRNAGFEEAAVGGVPSEWVYEAKKVGNKGTVSVVRAKAHSGQYSLKLAPNRNNQPWDLVHNPLGIGQGFPAAPLRGQKVYVSGWLAAEGGATAVLGAYVVLKSGAVAPLELRHTSSEPGPAYHEDVLVVPDRGDLSYLVVNCMVEGTSGAAYFDDVYASTRAPTGRTAEAQPPAGAAVPQPPTQAQNNEAGETATGIGNMIRNPGFEEAAVGGVPSEWVYEAKKVGNKGTVSVVRVKAHSGQYSLKLAPNRNNQPWDLAHSPLGIGQGFPAAPLRGQKVYVSGWLAAEGGATAVLGAYVVLKSGAVAPLELRHTSSEPGPAYHEDVLVVPDRGDLSYLVVNCMVEGTSGAAYFDDVYASTRAPTGRTAEAQPPDTGGPLHAAIQINAGQQIRHIPRGIYGTNLEWIWDGNGVWDKRKNDLNQDILALTRELHVSLFRFPGGIFADFYHWKDGIGAQASRRDLRAFPGGPNSVHIFGTEEALSFAEKAGGHLMITVNAITGTPEEAAEWVRYVNGRKAASDGQRRVDYWEVGNESYVGDGPEHVKAARLAPDEYARRFLAFARAMRAADPAIKIGAIGDENYGTVMARRYPDWTEQVLRIAGREMDFLSVHNAYAPALYVDKGWDVRTVYAAMLASPLLIRDSLADISRKVERLAPGRNITIAVTEWGPYFETEPSGRFIDHVKTLGSALFVAETLKVFIESPRTDLANFFKLADSLWMGWIGPRGNSYIPKAPYFAFQMFTRHFGSVLVGSTADSPAYNSRSNVGWVNSVPAVPYLDVISSRSDDGKTLYLMVINKHFDRAIQAKIALRGFDPTGTGIAWTLEGTGLDANTGTELYKAPGVTWARQAADTNPRFDRGSPGEVRIESAPLRGVSAGFEHTFPARSLTSLEIRGN